MLVLSRKAGEAGFIGKDINVVVFEVKGNRVRIGIDAPEGYRIVREELFQAADRTDQSRSTQHKELLYAA